jgi:hypothetical protein
MPTCSRRSLGFARQWLAVALGVVCAAASSLAAQQPEAQDGQARLPRCGKAHAAARLAEVPRVPMEDAYREAMDQTDVLHYELDIEVSNLNSVTHDCTITGSNRMTIQSKSYAVTEFTFRLRSQYTITSALINDTPPSVTVTTVPPRTRVVTLDRTYGMDEVFTLTIEYTGTSVPDGPWNPIYVSTQPGAGAMVATMSCPYFSYTWWPVKDGDAYTASDHSDKATMDFSITVPENLTVPSNGFLQSVYHDTEQQTKRYEWASDYPITPYLVCFAGAEYNTWTIDYTYPGGTMPVEFYIYPAWDTDLHRRAWEEAVDMLEVYRSLYGEYPFVEEKYGIYNGPFGGGMEHQTMTAQGGSSFAFDEYLTAHELSHQWWGDLVTCKTWNHVWLNEGFATYTEALWAEFKPGSSGLPALKSYMTTLRYTGAGSVYVTEAEVGNIYAIFDGNTSYNKGAWVVHMLRHVLGDEKFFDALAAYRAAFAFSAATTEDFQEICESFYPGRDLEWFFDEWIYGQYTPAYSWGWDSVQVNGQDYLLLHVDQTQAAYIQRFTMPLDVVVDGQTYVIFNDADPEHFVIPVPSAPSSVALDPDNWVLWSTRTQASYVAGPPKIVETDPPPGARLGSGDAPDTVTVTFHTNVDTAASHFSLVKGGASPQSFTIGATGDVNPVVLELAAPLTPGVYTLTVSEDLVATDSGMALDGELSDPRSPESLPSGDGEPGGDAIIKFTVSGDPIPAVSTWGFVAMVLLLLAGGTILFGRRMECMPWRSRGAC